MAVVARGLARPTGAMFHMNYGMVYRPVGWGDLAVGLVCWWIVGALLAAATAALYNRSVGSPK